MTLSKRTTSRSSELTGTNDLIRTGGSAEPWDPWAQEGGNNDDGQGHAAEDDPEL